MTTQVLSELDAIRKAHGCPFDQRTGSTHAHAARWSKQVLDGAKSLADGLSVPAQAATFPRHEPLLKLLKKKFEGTGFGWTIVDHVRKSTPNKRVVQVVRFHNYPGADKGHMLTLADLFILPVGDVAQYAEAMRVAHRRTMRKTKRRRGAGCFDGSRPHAWSS